MKRGGEREKERDQKGKKEKRNQPVASSNLKLPFLHLANTAPEPYLLFFGHVESKLD
jgi:hypothetical protein